jgi:N-acetylglutamate synthase-like GNAT family acetyltransferase
MENSIKVRGARLTRKDIDRLSSLMNPWDDLPADLTRNDIKKAIREIKKFNSLLLIAEDDEGFIGCAYFPEVFFPGIGKSIELQPILADQAKRRRDAESTLLKEAESSAKKNGCARTILSSSIYREHSRRFYKKYEYHITNKSYCFQKTII